MKLDIFLKQLRSIENMINGDSNMEKAKKYILTEETIHSMGRTLYRIKRLSDGLLGGYIESEKNLSQEGSCFVYDMAEVHGNAKVSENALVMGKSRINGNSKVSGNALVMGNSCINGNSKISGNANVAGEAWVSGDATVSGNACVSGRSWVYGYAEVSGNAKVSGNANVSGNAEVSGTAKVSGYDNLTGNDDVLRNNKAKKNDELDQKPDLSIIPSILLEQLAYCLMVDAEKHGRRDFEKGDSSNQLSSAAQRHLKAIDSGENIDKDCTNRAGKDIYHWACVAANATMALRQIELGTHKFDNKEECE